MPWYLRDYKQVGYAGRVPGGNDKRRPYYRHHDAGRRDAGQAGARYQLVGIYPMRPGVTLYTRRDLLRL
jgi:hypothetical protein